MKILIMAGGTGGHIFPALAVADHLRAQGHDVSWLGTRAGLEAEVVPRAGYAISYISVSGLRGKSWLGWLLAPTKLSLAFLQSLKILMSLRPQAVLGMGGFVTGPGGFSAWLLDKPLIIHEQNAIAGLTNRLLAALANKVLEGFPASFPAKRKALHVGNPVRAEITALPNPMQRFTARSGPLRLLVLGGSLGAQALNEVTPRALQTMNPDERPEVWHQAGARNIEAAQRHYDEAGVTARVVPFIDAMAEAYGWADLVLCRAGALTVAELACAGVAAILVPYPHAVDDHQTHNANTLVRAGAAISVPQTQLSAEWLRATLLEFHGTRERLLDMALAARALARPDATADVARLCLEAAHV